MWSMELDASRAVQTSIAVEREFTGFCHCFLSNSTSFAQKYYDLGRNKWIAITLVQGGTLTPRDNESKSRTLLHNAHRYYRVDFAAIVWKIKNTDCGTKVFLQFE